MPAKWNEDDYKAAGYRTVKLRLAPEVGKALAELAPPKRAAWYISHLILAAYAKSTMAEKKVRRKG